jgi:hypothetical protein
MTSMLVPPTPAPTSRTRNGFALDRPTHATAATRIALAHRLKRVTLYNDSPISTRPCGKRSCTASAPSPRKTSGRLPVDALK